jgi:acetyl-CoA acetyltransferase
MKSRPFAAIVGIGLSRISRHPIGDSRSLAVEAVMAALKDAGLQQADVDGLLINRSPTAAVGSLPLSLQRQLGLSNLSMLTCVDGEGCSAIQMLQYASLALSHGQVKNVVCVFADARMQGGQGAASFAKTMTLTGSEDWDYRCGLQGAIGSYALSANRYLSTYGATADVFGHYVLANRRWAQLNDNAFLRQELTMDDYLQSRLVVDPLRLLDCPYPVNGSAAIVLTATERATDFQSPPIFVQGMGQGHVMLPQLKGSETEARTGASLCADAVYGSAGVKPSDVSLCEFYDNFSFVGLRALEDYGFCGLGEAGAFVSAGHTSPGGKLPVSTGGGHLSDCYLQGMTPLIEAIVQGRRQGGGRQAENCDVILTTGVGGMMDYHAAMILSPLPLLN